MNAKAIKLMVVGCCTIGMLLPFNLTHAQTKETKKRPASIMKSCDNQCLAQTKTITFYENKTIPAGIGISTGVYTNVNGYRYINIFVDFEQTGPDEKPVSLGVVFALTDDGKLGSRRYFTFEQNFAGTANAQMITVSGEGTWHGTPHNRSSYIARFPIMGPYIQVFPFNHEDKDRKITIKAYLST